MFGKNRAKSLKENKEPSGDTEFSINKILCNNFGEFSYSVNRSILEVAQ